MIQRNNQLDILKGILTIGMVFAHTIQFLYGGADNILTWVSTYTNLVSFPGFLACFGFACWSAYFSKETLPYKKIIITSMKCYIAFIISGVAFRMLVPSTHLELESVIKIITLRDIPGYSEFLISFSLIIILSSVLVAPLKITTKSPKNILAFSVFILILSQIITKDYTFDPLVGLLLGGAGFYYFPTLIYSPFFIFGIWLSRTNPKYNEHVLLACLILVFLFTVLTRVNYEIYRFPPTPLWIIFSFAVFYVYLGGAILIDKYFHSNVKAYISLIGRNVLLYLIISNLILFCSYALGFWKSLSTSGTVCFYIFEMSVIYFIQAISVDAKQASNTLQQTN